MKREQLVAAITAGVLGAGGALGVGACGDDEGRVEVEGSTAGTSSSTATDTAPTEAPTTPAQ